MHMGFTLLLLCVLVALSWSADAVYSSISAVPDLKNPIDLYKCKNSTVPYMTWMSEITGCECTCDKANWNSFTRSVSPLAKRNQQLPLDDNVFFCVRNCEAQKPDQICEYVPGRCCPVCFDVKKNKKLNCYVESVGLTLDENSIWRNPLLPCQTCHCLRGSIKCSLPICPFLCKIQQSQVIEDCCNIMCLPAGNETLPVCIGTPLVSQHSNYLNLPQLQDSVLHRSIVSYSAYEEKRHSETLLDDEELHSQSKQFLHGDRFLERRQCIDHQCRCLNGHWHCIEMCIPTNEATVGPHPIRDCEAKKPGVTDANILLKTAKDFSSVKSLQEQSNHINSLDFCCARCFQPKTNGEAKLEANKKPTTYLVRLLLGIFTFFIFVSVVLLIAFRLKVLPKRRESKFGACYRKTPKSICMLEKNALSSLCDRAVVDSHITSTFCSNGLSQQFFQTSNAYGGIVAVENNEKVRPSTASIETDVLPDDLQPVEHSEMQYLFAGDHDFH